MQSLGIMLSRVLFFDGLDGFAVARASELVTLNLPEQKSWLATYQSHDGVIVQHKLAWLCCISQTSGAAGSALIVGTNCIFL